MSCTRRLGRAVLPKELEAAESLRSRSKLTLRWEITFLLGQHNLELKPRLLLAGLDRANALRFYHDSSFNVELSVEEQLAFDEARVYEVEEIEEIEEGRN